MQLYMVIELCKVTDKIQSKLRCVILFQFKTKQRKYIKGNKNSICKTSIFPFFPKCDILKIISVVDMSVYLSRVK